MLASCAAATGVTWAGQRPRQGRAAGLVETLATLPRGGVFYLWLLHSGLADALDAMPQATVFVPVDGIWVAPYRVGHLDDLARRHLVRQHLCDQLLDADEAPEQLGRNLNAAELRISRDRVNGVPILSSGLRARNGVIHLIDGFIT